MKTYKHLYPSIYAFDNLLFAAKNAQKGKRFQDNVGAFNFNLEKEILQLQDELQNQTYQPGSYTTFWITDPKARMISAAPYRDRVVHHALCHITAPIFEKTFIFDSYANRKGKGTHAAIERYRFDHYVTEELKVGGYTRYVDDFVIFDNDKARLWDIRAEMTDYLSQMRLLPHPNKTHIHLVAQGVPFLGFKVTPQYRVIKKENTKRYFRFLGKKLEMRRAGQLSPQDLENGLNAWLGHVRFGQNERLEKRVFRHLRAYGVEVYRSYTNSWRVLEPHL